MKYRRHMSEISILIVASVFLCLFCSCGIPTFLVPTHATVSKLNSDPLSPETIEINVRYQSESSVPGSVDRVGLLLLYYLDDTDGSSQHSNIISRFRSNFKINDYDGIAAYIRASVPLIEYSDLGSDYKVYAFTNDGSVASAPFYNLELPNDGPVNMDLTLTYDAVHHSVTVIDNSDSSVLAELGFDGEGIPDGEYINVFAAISVQSQNYSNLYWSNLNHVGTLR